jgi:hypothetical protein
MVTIEPSTAKVTVDGVERSLDEGRLRLEGQPGKTFAIVVTDGKTKVDHTVTITDVGTAVPAAISLDSSAGPASSASKGAQPMATRRPSTPPAASPGGKAGTPEPKPPPTPAKTSKPTAEDTWVD